MDSLALKSDPTALSHTMRYLASVVGVDPDPETLESWTRRAPEGSPAFANGLLELGMRGHVVAATVADVAQFVRRDMPMVAKVELATGEGWVVLDGRRFGRLHCWGASVYLPQGWVRTEEVSKALGNTVLEWIRIEAALPASALTAIRDDDPPIQRLARLLVAEREAIAVVVVYAIAVGVLALATPLAIQVLINWLAFGAIYQPVVVLSGGLLLCLLFASGLGAAQRYTVELLQRRLFVRTVADLGSRLSRVRLESLDGHYGPELVNRFFDILTLQKAVKTLLVDGLAAFLQAFVGLFVLAVYHPYLLVFDVIVVSLAAAALLPLRKRGEYTAIKESKVKYQVAEWIEEIARHPLMFKLGGGDLGEARLEQLSRDYVAARDGHFRVFFGQYLGMQAVTVVVQVGLLLTAGWLVLEGQLTLGQLVAAEFIVASALMGLTKFTDKLETVYDLLAGMDKLGTLMDLEPERMSGARMEQPRVGTSLSLRAVRFWWPGARESVPLEASLEVKSGERISVLGGNGVGKSTLANVMAGIRTPSHGSVWRDDIPLTRLLPEQVFAETLLLRAGALVHDTVYDNLTLGRTVDEDDVWRALKSVGLSEVIEALPEGINTELGVEGAPLSSRHGRALILARALVRPPRLLILDGLLDGVSPSCSRRWAGVLRELPRATTVVVFTDNPSTANQFERSVEIRDGGLHGRSRLAPV